ncbi:MAG: class I SAM-dependent methyltransferase [Chloroflexota bacterium]
MSPESVERPRDHKGLIREEFTRQAPRYAANPTVADPDRAARLVSAIQPSPDARVLEVATGPGYIALGFATACREVIGIDLTEAPLAIAERHRQERGLTNVRFEVGDAEQLQFDDQEFDVVVCCLALHHFENPGKVLGEMVRVCRRNGQIGVEDLMVSEHAERAAFHNRFEILRDPSHTRGLPLRELLDLFAAAGLEVEYARTEIRPQDAERWLANSHTPAERAAEVRAMLERDAAENLSGTYPTVRDGRIGFNHRVARVVGRRLAR